MPPRTRGDEYHKIAEDFLRQAENAPTKEEREDFLDMARAIERAAAKGLNDREERIPRRRRTHARDYHPT
jgi:hypothetical protein